MLSLNIKVKSLLLRWKNGNICVTLLVFDMS